MALSDRLNQYQPYALAALRIMTGLLFMEHGTQKLLAFPAGGHFDGPLPTLILIQGILEAVGGLAIVLGLFTRIVAFILSGNMAVAYFMAHMPRNFFPVNNEGDAAILYCFVFLLLVFAGPGLLAIDGRRK
ncbi:DoxX family protein [Rhizobium sp. LEGMi198b]|uniref:DoxX family protein n=1 Tax=unclassified Rhizobium TaxID=2613769 RepID=UPI000CDF4DC7|nr:MULTISPECIES: DoxX family protein [Rhizobium]AVA21685.1 DoxX family protein [Rhizobium sp. NXC24]MDK4737610.1 DoxX family protein [Rhizobium sp. CNPSo 3464]UWU22746.1 DoxX family protein [Rhizobium tropici]WFU03537.1 DoxX family protein [Rhizobium sp. CB3171]